jgi:hypothetical protein
MVNALIIIVRLNVGVVAGVVIVRVMVVSIIRKTIPGVVAFIETEPGDAIPSPPATAPVVPTVPVPIAMCTGTLSRENVISRPFPWLSDA